MLPFSQTLHSFFGLDALTVQATETEMPSDAVRVDFSDLSIKNRKLTYHITSDGSYYFTGNNMRNGTFVPSQIVVDSGVNADIWMDGLKLTNVDGSTNGCNHIMGTACLVIEGDASLHVVNESELISYAQAFGTIYVKEGASLTMEEGELLKVSATGDMTNAVCVEGAFIINDGKLEVKSNSSKGPAISVHGQIEAGVKYGGYLHIKGGEVSAYVEGNVSGIGLKTNSENGTIHISGGKVYAGCGSFGEEQGTAIGGRYIVYSSGDNFGDARILIDGGDITVEGEHGIAAAEKEESYVVIRGGNIRYGY